MQQSLKLGLLGTPTGKTLYRSNVLIYGFGDLGKTLASRFSHLIIYTDYLFLLYDSFSSFLILYLFVSLLPSVNYA